MNIALVGSFPPPYGGQSIHISNIKNFIIKNNARCTIFNTGQNQNLQADSIINIRKMPLLLFYLTKMRFDLIHVHVAGYTNYQKILPMLLYHFFLRRKWLITFHSGDTKINFVNPIIKYLVNKTILTAHKIICVNKEIYKNIVTQGIPSSKCLINPAFSINANLTDNNFNEESKAFIKHHSPILSCVGMYEPQYGLDTALSCLALLKEKFPQIGCFFICSGGTQKENLLSQVKQAGLSNYIILLDDVPHDECIKIIGKSDIFIRPTLYDGDAISVREAIALGVPVVASNTSFRPIGTVTFEIDDVASMAKVTIDTLRHSSKGSKRPSAGISEKYLEEILKIYTSACKQN